MRTLLISLRLAWRTLMQNKVRSFLTLLGMIIGVGAVIAIVSLGEGLRADFEKQMSGLGVDVFYMMPKAPKRPGQAEGMPRLFKMNDLEEVERQCTLISRIVPGIASGATAKYRERTEDITVSGFDYEYLKYSVTAKLDKGRFFSKAEYQGRARVAVIGIDIADDLFGEYGSPLGETVKVNGVGYLIIGTLKQYTGMVNEGGDVNRTFIIPLTTMQERVIGSRDVFWVSIYLVPGAKLEQAKEEVAQVMRQRRRVRNASDDDFQFISPDDFKKMGNQFINVVIGTFGAIAFLSLLVGGVGIMNIMLVSVTERTREIGLRMALGAGRPTVLTQFLTEAVVLTLIGGVIGMAVGYAGAVGISAVLNNVLKAQWTPTIPMQWVVLSVAVSLLTGIVFGVYPAYKASQLDPVEAMRYE